MNIGVAIALFLVLSIVLLILFCAVTKYFHHKLQKALEAPEEVYSMVDEINAIKDQSGFTDSQEDYEKIRPSEWREPEMKVNSPKKCKRKDNLMIQMNDLKQPLKDQTMLLGVSALRKRLDGDSLPLLQESSRSAHTLKSFPVERLNSTRRSKRSQVREETPATEPPKTFKFVSKMVCYDVQGIIVIDVNIKSIKLLREGVLKEDKKHKSTLIPVDDLRFDDQLEMYGFELGELGCVKYEIEVELPQEMVVNEQCQIKQLPAYESKQPIQIEEYLCFKNELGIAFITPDS